MPLRHLVSITVTPPGPVTWSMFAWPGSGMRRSFSSLMGVAVEVLFEASGGALLALGALQPSAGLLRLADYAREQHAEPPEPVAGVPVASGALALVFAAGASPSDAHLDRSALVAACQARDGAGGAVPDRLRSAAQPTPADDAAGGAAQPQPPGRGSVHPRAIGTLTCARQVSGVHRGAPADQTRNPGDLLALRVRRWHQQVCNPTGARLPPSGAPLVRSGRERIRRGGAGLAAEGG